MKTFKATPKGLKYYMVVGKNGHIPKTYYTKATCISIAKNHFYLECGDNVNEVYQISKKSYLEGINQTNL